MVGTLDLFWVITNRCTYLGMLHVPRDRCSLSFHETALLAALATLWNGALFDTCALFAPPKWVKNLFQQTNLYHMSRLVVRFLYFSYISIVHVTRGCPIVYYSKPASRANVIKTENEKTRGKQKRRKNQHEAVVLRSGSSNGVLLSKAEIRGEFFTALPKRV